MIWQLYWYHCISDGDNFTIDSMSEMLAARIRHGRSIEIFVHQGDTGDTGVG